MASASASGRVGRRWGVGAVLVLVLGGFAVAVLVGLVRGTAGTTATIPAPATMSAAPTASSAMTVYVHVAGAVGAPGLYPLPADARAVDAIAVAGGFAADADRSAVNLARTVADGEQIVVPVVGQVADPAAPGAPQDAVLDLNTADAAALEELPGIGPALAERILSWRDENGRFSSVEDLLAVPGIGEKLLEGLRDAVRV